MLRRKRNVVVLVFLVGGRGSFEKDDPRLKIDSAINIGQPRGRQMR